MKEEESNLFSVLSDKGIDDINKNVFIAAGYDDPLMVYFPPERGVVNGDLNQGLLDS